MPTRKATNRPSVSEYPLLFFETPSKWRDWLEQNHSNVTGVWLEFYKKGSVKIILDMMSKGEKFH
jgi:uncharacterized protein YdeI (YjbR/CyaY-like superfamily)